MDLLTGTGERVVLNQWLVETQFAVYSAAKEREELTAEIDHEELSDSLQRVEVKSQEDLEKSQEEKIESKVAGRKRKASDETDKPNKKMKSGSPQVWFHIKWLCVDK